MKKYLKYIGVGLVAVIFLSVLITMYVNTNKERKEDQLVYRQQGIEYYEQEEYEKALTAFQSALDLALGDIDETEMDICFYKARTQFELGDTEGALATYNSIITYNEHPKAYFLRGNLYYSLGEEEKALADYEKAAEKESKDYDLYIGIYEILASKDKVGEGQAYLNKALEIKSDKAADKIQKGYINLLLGEYETAVGLLEEASKDDPESYYYLFLAYDSMGNSEKAMENLNAYMEKSEDLDSYKLYEFGTNLLKQEQYESAIECFCNALAMEKVPNKQAIMKNLVVAYERCQDYASAKEVMKEYIAEYPEDEEAQREYTFLETR